MSAGNDPDNLEPWREELARLRDKYPVADSHLPSPGNSVRRSKRPPTYRLRVIEELAELSIEASSPEHLHMMRRACEDLCHKLKEMPEDRTVSVPLRAPVMRTLYTLAMEGIEARLDRKDG